jgi:hypothetical protein
LIRLTGVVVVAWAATGGSTATPASAVMIAAADHSALRSKVASWLSLVRTLANPALMMIREAP